jgi:hypothetical protein
LIVSVVGAGSLVVRRNATGHTEGGGATPSSAAASRPSGAASSSEASSLETAPSATQSPQPITASTTVTSTSGAFVWADNFEDRNSGWVASGPSLYTTYVYGQGSYMIGSKGGAMHHLVYAPNRMATQQMSASLTASLVGAGTGTGFGVSCRRGAGSNEVAYEFILLVDGRFFVERRDGEPNLTAVPFVLEKGVSPTAPGTTAITVTAICATLEDGRTTRLLLFVDGSRLVDFLDSTSLVDPGWLAGIDVASSDTPSTLTATYFEIRDLSK